MPEKESQLGFLIFFIGVWCGINVILSLVSGWFQLSKKFSCPTDFQTKYSCGLTTMALGIPYFSVNYSHCIFVHIGDAGIRVSILFIFRILSPPILIPWSEMESVRRVRYMLFNTTVIKLRNENRRFRFFWGTGETIFEMCKQKGIQTEA